jgi:transposase-like protein
MDVNIMDLIKEYGSEDKCRKYLEALRWPNGPRCRRCGSVNTLPIPQRGQYRCRDCEYHFSVTAGTIFQDSHLPLTKWFLTTYMMIDSKKKSISANQIKRTIGVSYKTAWYLCHRIREAMKDANPERLSGIVEVDETYIGGKRKGIGRGNYRPYKTAVIGAVERGGAIRFRVIPKTDKKHLYAFIKDVTKPETAAIYTDEEAGYKGIGDADTKHEAVNHSAGEYVRAGVHTNTVESAWSLFKRSIVGAYHQISTKHMPKYFDEQAWRFDNRGNEYLFRDTMFKLLEAKTMPFKALVNSV